jgi:hypothetical protein
MINSKGGGSTGTAALAAAAAAASVPTPAPAPAAAPSPFLSVPAQTRVSNMQPSGKEGGVA